MLYHNEFTINVETTDSVLKNTSKVICSDVCLKKKDCR